MSSGQRLGKDPLDWIGAVPDVPEASGEPRGGAGNSPPPEPWRSMKLKGDRKEFKAAMSERLERERVAEMLGALAGFLRAGSFPLGEGERAAALDVGALLDLEASASLKKGKARVRIELEWRNQ